MLNKIKGYFSGKTAFQKKVLCSSLISTTDEILLDDLLFLITAFEQAALDSSNKSPVVEEYFKLMLEE
jgi:hypothetical protein